MRNVIWPLKAVNTNVQITLFPLRSYYWVKYIFYHHDEITVSKKPRVMVHTDFFCTTIFTNVFCQPASGTKKRSDLNFVTATNNTWKRFIYITRSNLTQPWIKPDLSTGNSCEKGNVPRMLQWSLFSSRPTDETFHWRLGDNMATWDAICRLCRRHTEELKECLCISVKRYYAH